MDKKERAPGRRFRPLAAARALRAVFQDPDDTASFFALLDTLPGRSPELQLARMKATPEGAALLTERLDLARVLSDRAALRELPEGSLGRAYLAFVERAGISAAGLVDLSRASNQARRAVLPDDLVYFGERLRDSHDLWHVVTGFGPDLVGEAGVLAFTFAQTRTPSIGLFLAAVWARGLPGGRAAIRESYGRGRRAAWLPPVRWESMLARPLEEVREPLRFEPPPGYVPITSAELRASGMLAPRAAAA